jgi:hypothetical protein
MRTLIIIGLAAMLTASAPAASTINSTNHHAWSWQHRLD